MMRLSGIFTALVSFACLLNVIVMPSGSADEDQGILHFEIKEIVTTGNTIFSSDQLNPVLQPFVGKQKTADDVEKARTALERFHHKAGYPTTLVNIPEQTVEDGVVRLEIIESRIRRVRVTGNRYFTMEKILKAMPAFRGGQILYVPQVQRELAEVNRNPDLKVAPVLIPGKELGTIDLELKVKDKLPLHGSLELNNRHTHNTTGLRLNGMVRYDNLWQKEHSVSLQFQTSPEDTDEVKMFSGAYVYPSFFGKDNMTVLYGVVSDSQSAFGEGFQVLGEGRIIGLREIIPLPQVGNYAHNLSVGLDYKDFDETLGFGDTNEKAPITYLPLSASYSSSLRGQNGITRFNASLNFSFRGLISDDDEFLYKRFKARANYICLTAGFEREQQMPLDMTLLIKGEGQIADQPLISNEQFVAGGVESVHGYLESEATGDNALSGNLSLLTPDLSKAFGLWEDVSVNLALYYDVACLQLNDPLPGEESTTTLHGIGAGIRGQWTNRSSFSLEWGQALSNTRDTKNGDTVVYFRFKYQL